MASRSVDDRFWSDGWVRKLNALDRYVFLYFLTNAHSTWCGIYELDLEMAAFETGVEEGDLKEAILPRLSPKIIYLEGWVVIPNWIEYHVSESGNLSPQQKEGIRKALMRVPERIRAKIDEMGIPYAYPMGGVSAYPILSYPILDESKDSSAPPLKGIPDAVRSKTTNSVRKVTLEEWLEQNNYKETEFYLGEDEGEVSGYKHPSRKRPFTETEVLKLYSKATTPSVRPKMPRRDEFHYDFDTWLERLRNSPSKTDKIVALIWKEKGYRFDNYEQWKTQFDMDKKFASQLKGYSGPEVKAAIDMCHQDASTRGYEWKSSTVVKKIAEIKR